jgi:hypothetical protein
MALPVHKSSNSPIDSLPDELLREILCCLNDNRTYYDDYDGDLSPEIRNEPRLRVAVHQAFAVCSRWKKIIDSTGGCWVLNLSLYWNLSFNEEENHDPDIPSFASRLSRWERAINTARNCDLVARIDIRATPTGALWDIAGATRRIVDCLLSLEARHHQLEDFHATFEECMMPNLWVPLCNILSLPLPRLTRLHIESAKNIRTISDANPLMLPRTLDLSHGCVLAYIHTSLPRFCRISGLPANLHDFRWHVHLASPMDWEHLHNLLRTSSQLHILHFDIDAEALSANPRPSRRLPPPKLTSLTLRSSERGLVEVVKALDLENVSTLDIEVLHHHDNGMEVQSFTGLPKLKETSLRISQWTPLVERMLLSLQNAEVAKATLIVDNSGTVFPPLLERPRVATTFHQLSLTLKDSASHWRQILGRMTFNQLHTLRLWAGGDQGLDGEAHNPQPDAILSMPALRKLILGAHAGHDIQNFVIWLSAPELNELIFCSDMSLPRPPFVTETPVPDAYSAVTRITFCLDFDSISDGEYENPLTLFPNAVFMQIRTNRYSGDDQGWTEEDRALTRMLNCLKGRPVVLPKLTTLAISIANFCSDRPNTTPELPRCKLFLLKASKWRMRKALPDLFCAVDDYERALWAIRNDELIDYDTDFSSNSDEESEGEAGGVEEDGADEGGRGC